MSAFEQAWTLLKATPRSRRQNRELQEMIQDMKNRVDNTLYFDERDRFYDPKRLNTFAGEVARNYREKHGTPVALRNLAMREINQDENFEEEPTRTQVFDEKAGGMQPHLTADVMQVPRPPDVRMTSSQSIENLPFPTNPYSIVHGRGTPAHTQATQLHNQRVDEYDRMLSRM